MASNDFNPVPQELITKFETILDRCEIKTENPQEPSLMTNYREELKKLKSDMKDPPKWTVAVYGDTGSGKSTLLNAILDQPNLVPKAGIGKACTAFAIRIEENKDDTDFAAEIEFLSGEEWRRELDVLTTDLKDTIPAEDESVFESARAMMTAVYGEIDIANLEESIKTGNEVTANLGTVEKIKRSNAKSLQDELWTFIDSGKNENKQVWPIVKQIILRVPSSYLCTSGIVFIDLPGVGDSNPARDRVAKKYVLDSDVLMVVANIKRAVDSKTAEDVIGKRMHRNAKMDGLRPVIVCTHSDIVEPEEVIERFGVTEAEEMTKKLIKLETLKMEKDQELKVLNAMSKTQAQLEELCNMYSCIVELNGQIEKLTKERMILCAEKRNKFVEDEMTSSKPQEKTMQVFCVSSTDYNKFLLSESSDLAKSFVATTTFTTVQQTNIPALRNFLNQASEEKREKKRTSIKSRFCSLVSELYNYLAIVELTCTTNQTTFKNDVIRMLDACSDQTEDLISKVEKAIEKTLQDNLKDAIDMGVKAAETQAPFVSSRWSIPVDRLNRRYGGLAFQTYKATVSRHGKYIQKRLNIDIDMNEDLCMCLINHMEDAWATTFSEETWRAKTEKEIKDPFYGIIKTVTTDIITSLKRAPGLHVTAVSNIFKRHEGIIKEKLWYSPDEIWKIVREQSQGLEPKLADTIKERMIDTYDSCRVVSGKGALQAIGEIMAKGIDQQKRSMFVDVKNRVHKILEDLKKKVVCEVTEFLRKMCGIHRKPIEALWTEQRVADVMQSKEDLNSLFAALDKLVENKGTKRKREDERALFQH